MVTWLLAQKNKLYAIGIILGGCLGFAVAEFSRSMCYYAQARDYCYEQADGRNYVMQITLGALAGSLAIFVLFLVVEKAFNHKLKKK